MEYHSRKPTRIPNYDYSSANYYFITICTWNHKCIFGQPNDLNETGEIVKKHIHQLSDYYQSVSVDKFVVMPNHIHMILVLNEERNPSVSQIIALFKTGVTKELRKKSPEFKVWQRSFHDHIIRTQASYEKIWLYIEANPMNWDKDCFYAGIREG